MSDPLDIPLRLVSRPSLSGLVIPWITLRTPNGRYHFGTLDADRAEQALRERRCQICGDPLDDLMIFFMRGRDLKRMISPEAAAHPVCARYAAATCPMLGGQMSHYHRNSVLDTLDVGLALALGDPSRHRAGAPAEQYQLVYARGRYTVIIDRTVGLPAAQLTEQQIVRIRQIPRPA